MQERKTDIYIGIDTGTHTGVAVWDSGEQAFTELQTLALHKALRRVSELHQAATSEGRTVKVIFEDARQRKWIPNSGDPRKEAGRRQGAGSVKRDASIWEEFLRDNGIPFEALAPRKGATKMEQSLFYAITGWDKRTSNHARDAAMLVIGR